MKKLSLLFCLLFSLTGIAQKVLQADVLIIGGGTGGTAAGIQCARMGVKTIIAESGPWLGGMISAAGVSAVDGNHRLPSGLWAEFRERIYKVYGGPDAVATGWVSNTQFEPHVADSIFKAMAAQERLLTVLHHLQFHSLVKEGAQIKAARFTQTNSGAQTIIEAKVFIDATELGDVLAAAGVPYNVGMEANAVAGDNVGIEQSANIVQDLTYVAILKDYGPNADHTIAKPNDYNPAEFDGACTDYHLDKNRKAPSVDKQKMLDYGKLPNNKYMINWPIYGNDTYLNVVGLSPEQREKELMKAKETTLRFVYFIQHQLGFKHLGLADDEFPTSDKLALMPYHREGRRAKGLVRLNMRHIAEPFTYGHPLYRTGISVGDYPIDHHHKKNEAAPQHLEFYPIPSFNVPLGALIPQGANNLIVAEKGISVSNVVNGTTRLQPCVLLTGQAAGILAALSVQKNKMPKAVSVRLVQEHLLKSKAYIMPYIDITPEHPHFEAVQKIGATGILKGTGIPYQWANQTWFYPDSLVNAAALAQGLNDFKKGTYSFARTNVTVAEAVALLERPALNPKTPATQKPSYAISTISASWQQWGLQNFDPSRNITRLELAVLLHHTINPFSIEINHNGGFVH